VSTLLRPNTELVGTAWLGTIAGLSPQMVATQLPADVASWKTSGFITAVVSGGSPNVHNPMRNPVFAVDCWAVNPGSNKPPWFQANQLAEIVDAGCRATDAQRWLTMPAGYDQARVLTAYFVTEPRRVYDDGGSYARYAADLQIHWTAAS
jgi:hypothetical protein